MKTFARTFLLSVIFLTISSTAFGQDSINSVLAKIDTTLMLVKSDLPNDYTLFDYEIPYNIKASSLYNKIELYSKFLKIKLIEKKCQSIKSPKEKGTVYLFLFIDSVDKAKIFAQDYIWEAKHPSNEHPDEIIVKGNTLIVLSFAKNSIIKDLVKLKIQGN